MELTFEDLLALNNLNEFEPDQVCNILAIIFETGREQNDKNAIERGLGFSEKQKLDNFSDYEKATFHYFVSNGWAYLQRFIQTLNSVEFWAFQTPEIENQVIHLRMALTLTNNFDSPELKSQILINLGNTFSHIGRFVEATQYWQKAMRIMPGFGMAVGNLGFGLAHYARALYDEGHRFLFCQFAYKYLVEASTRDDVYKEGQDGFKYVAETIKERYGADNLKNIKPLTDFSLGNSKEETAYREWCIQNTLFINPLNDFLSENIVGHDCFYLPTITLDLDQPPVYHTIYNQIKQEYVSARFLYYEGINQTEVHFSDKENKQMDTLDYSLYSINTEKLKIVFRVCYSLFDKIAYLLNEYLQLGLNPKDVSFRKIWCSKSRKNNQSELNPIIINSQNWPLRGMYWLSKDLVEFESQFSKAILPEAQQIATIRNFIEHKSFKIVEYGETGLTDNDLTFQITRDEFEEKVYVLMQMARSAIMYLSFAIHIEEQKKEKKPSIPVTFYELKDDYKI
ncbi:LA2681 family HEPN domain-containing protein [Niabella drilacis]|uniref:LA2681-like HEPN domain-containing protein n=1 Tax=Niabella drilacis (strain DSM 25811 / CCM 8410 / CCUG 62505 / LMG 26954 / E90) TaxID=1285928 RepID=A0A1G6QYL4_NIADE|nr:LA2681 family HEPN domain-containing protein [Niabella drilacis]SDC96827.1 hypothetical protein SAMN04487894_10554 [Niabella drilacis]